MERAEALDVSRVRSRCSTSGLRRSPRPSFADDLEADGLDLGSS